jgi:hypothetical protein
MVFQSKRSSAYVIETDGPVRLASGVDAKWSLHWAFSVVFGVR